MQDLTQDAPRPNSEDIYCAAIGVLSTETIQTRAEPDPADEAAVAAMTLYFLGRVEGSMPQGADAAEAVIDMASVLTPSTIPEADLRACGRFMQDQGLMLADEARRRGRSFR